MDEIIKIPNGKSLLPFQKEAVERMLTFLLNGNGVYNAAEMGLGKTVQTIAALNTLPNDHCNPITHLIICPAVMRLTWEAEIRKWSTFDKPRIHIVEKGADMHSPKLHSADYLIVSYDQCVRATSFEILRTIPLRALVLDEAHYLKSFKAKRTINILKFIWPNAKYHIALSGTPFTKAVVDGYTLFNRFDPKSYPSFSSFAARYSHSRQIPIGRGKTVTKYFGVKNAEELAANIKSKFYIRYKKDECLKDLPNKIYNRIILPSDMAIKFPKNSPELAHMLEVIRRLEGDEEATIPNGLVQMKRLQGLSKADAVAEYTKDLLEQDIPVVLFAWHRDVISQFCETFKEYKPAVITGDTPAEDRQKAMERFQGGETELFIGNLASAGVGITLTRSSNVVMGELDWSPSVIQQAIDRCHRITQKDCVNVHYFVVKDSIDEKITDILMEKSTSFKKVLDAA